MRTPLTIGGHLDRAALVYGDRIGVVGRNGGGKTSLLSVIEGSRPLDGGRVVRTGDVTIGMLSQTDRLDPEASVQEEVLGEMAEHEWAGDPRVRTVLEGLLEPG